MTVLRQKAPASSRVTWTDLPEVRRQDPTAPARMRGDNSICCQTQWNYLIARERARLPEPGRRSGRRRSPSSCAALVPMVQTTHFRERNDGPFCRRLDASRRGRVLLERDMRSRPMIAGNASSKHAMQMTLAQNDDVIQTLAAQGSDQSLRE